MSQLIAYDLQILTAVYNLLQDCAQIGGAHLY